MTKCGPAHKILKFSQHKVAVDTYEGWLVWLSVDCLELLKRDAQGYITMFHTTFIKSELIFEFLKKWDICVWKRLTRFGVVWSCDGGMHIVTLQYPTLSCIWMKWDVHIWKWLTCLGVIQSCEGETYVVTLYYLTLKTFLI